MSNIAYIYGWDESLCIRMNYGENSLCDFNRLFFRGIPSTKHLQQGKVAISANRDKWVTQLKDRFAERIAQDCSHATLHTIFANTLQYLSWCDPKSVIAFTKISLEKYCEHLIHRVHLKQIKRATYTAKLSYLTILFRDYLDLPTSWFASIPLTGRGDIEPFEAYTRSDLNQLLPLLRQLFNQTSKQFLESPQKHIDAWKTTPTMVFHWKEQVYPLRAGITKMMCAAAYLLSYYTYCNTGVILGLKRPNNASASLGGGWYTMPAFKRRAFQTIHVEIGQHNLEIPKYCMEFFHRLLEVSNVLDSSDEALLLQTYADRILKPMKSSKLQAFSKLWLNQKLTLTDQTGAPLRPVISRFRETGAQLTAYHQGDIANNILMDNTDGVRRKHYSSGNKHINNGMMQDTVAIRQAQAENRKGAKAAQASLGIQVLTIEEEYRINIPELSRTPNGGSCSNPFGEKSEAYNRRAKKHNLLKEGEKLACADLLSCFGCPDQVIVQSVSDIWCLLSFRACIEESLYLHLDAHHYRQNFESIVNFIDNTILPKIKKPILKQAESKLNDEGYHPLWNESESILSMIPTNQTATMESVT